MKWRIPVAIVSLVLWIWGMLPLFIARNRGIGVIAPVTVGTLGLAAVLFPKQTIRFCTAVIQGGKAVHAAAFSVGAVVAILVILFLVVSVLMIIGASRTVPPDQPVTVIVPGAQIRGAQPSLMLSHRLQAAAEVLAARPDAVCVVSGGQGADEEYSEAAVMRAYLLSLGIAAERIYMEDTSTNTLENMQHTYTVIRNNGLPETVVIATQEFHQFRCAAYARQSGLQPVGAAVCGTPWYLLLCFWVREFAGICRMWLLGY